MNEREPKTRGWGANRHRKYARAQWVSDTDMLARMIDETRGLAEDGTVVELGCGLGTVIAAFADIAGQCIAVDHDENMLKQASRQDKVHYVHDRIQDFKCEPADVVVARNVIHYVGSEALFEKAAELLRPRGLFLVCQAVPPSTAARGWHDRMHDMMSVDRAPSTDDLVSGFTVNDFEQIAATFHIHRMHVARWLDARVDDRELRDRLMQHHDALDGFPEYQSVGAGEDRVISVRFAIVTGTTPA